MSEVLSQSEIDELLRSLSEGTAPEPDTSANAKEKPIMPYDFARPQKINKEQQRTLEIMYDSYCRQLTSFLSGYLRTNVSLEVLSAEQVTFFEFSNALANPCILSLVELSPLKGSIILELSPNIGYAIIDRILGGPGTGVKTMRDFSEIEKILLERVMSHMLTPLPQTWENVIAMRTRLNQIETNSQFAQIIPPTETVALVTLSIKVGNLQGLMNFCLPIPVIDPVLDRLYTRYWFSQGIEADGVDYVEDLQQKIETADIAVSAVLGKTKIMVSDFVNLNIGDVILLDSYVDSELEIFVGPLQKFYAKPGINRGRNAIQITKLIEREE